MRSEIDICHAWKVADESKEIKGEGMEVKA